MDSIPQKIRMHLVQETATWDRMGSTSGKLTSL